MPYTPVIILIPTSILLTQILHLPLFIVSFKKFFFACLPFLHHLLHGCLIFLTGLDVSQGSCGEMGDHAEVTVGERQDSTCKPDRTREAV